MASCTFITFGRRKHRLTATILALLRLHHRPSKLVSLPPEPALELPEGHVELRVLEAQGDLVPGKEAPLRTKDDGHRAGLPPDPVLEPVGQGRLAILLHEDGGLPQRDWYSTGDLCKALGITWGNSATSSGHVTGETEAPRFRVTPVHFDAASARVHVPVTVAPP